MRRAARRQVTRDSQEIGPPPEKCTDPERKECAKSLRRFLEICFPAAFKLRWSPDHIRVIDGIEHCIRHGGLKAIGMPRGSGKTTIVMRAGLWAILENYQRFVTVVAATQDRAEQICKNLKREIEGNPTLRRLYGRELHTIYALEGETLRCRGQRYEGSLTGVNWGSDQIVFGYIPGVETSGNALSACGLTGGNLRGQQIVSLDGEVLRPTLFLVDDPQTKESAGSKTQSQSRYETIMGDILGMAGPGQKVTAFATITVIYRNDLADRILDRIQSPQWRGEKCKLVYRWPTNTKLWDEYASILLEDQRSDSDGTTPLQWVRDRFDQLHEGAQVAWEDRFDPSIEASALHAAINLKLRDEGAFLAEYQLEPLEREEKAAYDLNAFDLAKRTIPCPRGQLPEWVEKLTAFIDVQKDVLFWSVVGWSLQGRGFITDYGTYPDQEKDYYSKSSISKTLRQAAETDVVHEALYAGLDRLVNAIMSKQFRRLDGADIPVSRMAIDARWGFSTAVVRRFTKETHFRGRVHPSMGVYLGANGRQWHEHGKERGSVAGIHCRLAVPKDGSSGIRELLIDTNFHKTYVAESLGCGKEATRAIFLFDAKPHQHRLISEHFVSEDAVIVVGKRGNRCVEWRLPAHRPDNDFFDTLVGNCAVASIEGVHLQVDRPMSERKIRTLPELQEEAKEIASSAPGQTTKPIVIGGSSFVDLWKNRNA
jgi:hypothetical protein